MTRGSLTSLMLLALCTARRETWREGGTIDRAMAKDIQEELRSHHRPPDCQMSDEEWAVKYDPILNPSPSIQCSSTCML